MILTTGTNARRAKENKNTPTETPKKKPPRKRGQPPKPFSQMTGIEYMNWVDRAGRGKI